MQKEIKVNENGTVEVHISVEPSVGRVTEIRSQDVGAMLKEEGVKHGFPLPGNPVVSSDLHTAGVSLSGVFKFEAPEVVPVALTQALGVDPSMPSIAVKKPAPAPAPKAKGRTKKTTTRSKKTSTTTEG
jgi:hypothetical protein